MYKCICGRSFDEPVKKYDEELREFQDRCPWCGDWEFVKMDKTDMGDEDE